MGLAGNLQDVETWLQDNLSTGLVRFAEVGGGCINESGVISLTNGDSLFLKMHPGADADFFDAEAHGLQTLRDARAERPLRIPAVVHVDREFLLLEYLGQGKPRSDYWRSLGTRLAELHSRTYSSFGLERDNYCGRTPQINTPLSDGFEFFARFRLLLLAEKAHGMGLLDRSSLERFDELAGKLSEYIPEQPAVLIHGDLWSGNVHCDSEGHPALIDPACYRGWAEAELAMTALFGGFHEDFYRAYEHTAGIGPDWRERAPLYNLYHLLNHLILFGTGYLGQVQSVLGQYT